MLIKGLLRKASERKPKKKHQNFSKAFEKTNHVKTFADDSSIRLSHNIRIKSKSKQ